MTKLRFKITQKNQKNIEYQEIVWDLKNQINIDDFLKEFSEYGFKKAATIVKNKGVIGYKIKVTDEFYDKKFLVYLIVVGGKIIKVGKSKNTIDKRSYSAGTERNWVKTGRPSDVNYIYSQLFLHCLEEGIEVDFYAYEVPIKTNEYQAFGKMGEFNYSPYEEYEKTLNLILSEKIGKKLIGDGSLFLEYKE